MESSFADDEVLDFALAVRKSGGAKSGAAHTKIKTEMRRPAPSIGPPGTKRRALISIGCIAAFSCGGDSEEARGRLLHQPQQTAVVRIYTLDGIKIFLRRVDDVTDHA